MVDSHYIGLIGKNRGGKDTVSELITELVAPKDVSIMGFSDPINECLFSLGLEKSRENQDTFSTANREAFGQELLAHRWFWAITAVPALAWLIYLVLSASGATSLLERIAVGLVPLSIYATNVTIGNGQLVLHLLPPLIAGIVLANGQGRARSGYQRRDRDVGNARRWVDGKAIVRFARRSRREFPVQWK